MQFALLGVWSSVGSIVQKLPVLYTTTSTHLYNLRQNGRIFKCFLWTRNNKITRTINVLATSILHRYVTKSLYIVSSLPQLDCQLSTPLHELVAKETNEGRQYGRYGEFRGDLFVFVVLLFLYTTKKIKAARRLELLFLAEQTRQQFLRTRETNRLCHVEVLERSIGDNSAWHALVHYPIVDTPRPDNQREMFASCFRWHSQRKFRGSHLCCSLFEGSTMQHPYKYFIESNFVS